MLLQETEGAVTPEAILALTDKDIVEFMRNASHQKTLTKTVRALNADLMSGDRTQQAAARKALTKLGFI